MSEQISYIKFIIILLNKNIYRLLYISAHNDYNSLRRHMIMDLMLDKIYAKVPKSYFINAYHYYVGIIPKSLSIKHV